MWKHNECPSSLKGIRVSSKHFYLSSIVLLLLIIWLLSNRKNESSSKRTQNSELQRLLAISLSNNGAFESRISSELYYVTILKYYNFTLQTMKQPYLNNQPSGLLRCSLLSPVSFIVQLVYSTLHLLTLIYIECILFSILCVLGSCSIALFSVN